MRILFDHATPAPLRQALAAHVVVTAYEMGWTKLDNGALLNAAEAEFDVLITTDQNLQYTFRGETSPYWFCRQRVGPEFGRKRRLSKRRSVDCGPAISLN